MARIRSVHPGQWTDVGFVKCSPHARLLAIGLRNEADDHGIFVWEPLQLKIRLLPVDNVDVEQLLAELVEHKQVMKFADQSSKEYGAIRNFRRWQRPEKPSFQHPFPEEVAQYVGVSSKDGQPVGNNRRSGDDGGGGGRRPFDDHSPKVAPDGEERKGEERNGGEARASARDGQPKKKTRLEVALEPLKELEKQGLLHGQR